MKQKLQTLLALAFFIGFFGFAIGSVAAVFGDARTRAEQEANDATAGVRLKASVFCFAGLLTVVIWAKGTKAGTL